jgi:nucleoid DNA-binding protein
MDIDLLSKMVKELILDDERVVLPGLGSFVAEIVPATFSDKGYTINPPYRKLYFRSKPDGDSDLIPFYAKSNSVSEEIAEKVIVDFVSELKAVLFQKKTVIFPGLGRLRATKENNVFFVADEDLDIYPEGFGLEPISLKTHTASAVEVKTVVSGLKSILSEPIALPEEEEPEVVTEPLEKLELEKPDETPEEPEVEPEEIIITPFEGLPVAEPIEESDEPTDETDDQEEPEVLKGQEGDDEPESLDDEDEMEGAQGDEDDDPEVKGDPDAEDAADADGAEDAEEVVHLAAAKKNPFWKLLLKILLWIVIAAAVLCAAYVAVGHFCPEWIDQFLYTPEELEILNYR